MTTDIFRLPLLMVGCGNMAGQMLTRWLAQGLDPSLVTIVRPSGRPLVPGVTVLTDYPESLPERVTILLGMKPYQLGAVARKLGPIAGSRALLISILAGTGVDTLRRHFPQVADIVRAMPNTPVGLGQGVCTLYADAGIGAEAREATAALMHPLGLTEWIADEDRFELATALSGCGPAYLFRFIDALAAAGTRLGLPDDQAARLSLATVHGAARLAARSDEDPGTLADRVASPGGMTRQGMNVLDADERLVALLTDTLRAARDRGLEMASGG